MKPTTRLSLGLRSTMCDTSPLHLLFRCCTLPSVYLCVVNKTESTLQTEDVIDT